MIQFKVAEISNFLFLVSPISVIIDFDIAMIVILGSILFLSIITNILIHYSKYEKQKDYFLWIDLVCNLSIISIIWCHNYKELASMMMLEYFFNNYTDTSDHRKILKFNLYSLLLFVFYVILIIQTTENINYILIIPFGCFILLKVLFFIKKLIDIFNKNQKTPQTQSQEVNNQSFISKDTGYQSQQMVQVQGSCFIKTIKSIYEKQKFLIIDSSFQLEYCNFNISKLISNDEIPENKNLDLFWKIKCILKSSYSKIQLKDAIELVINQKIKCSYVKLKLDIETKKKIFVQIIYFEETCHLILNLIKFNNGSKIQKNLNQVLFSDLCKQLSNNLGTTLNTISNISSFALQDSQIDILQKEQYFTPININVQYLILIMSNLRDYNLIKLKEFDLKLEQFNIQDEILYIQSLFVSVIKQKKIQIINSFNETLTINDKFRFRQVYFQLFQNSIKYSEKGRIKTEIRLINSASEWYYQISILDNGTTMNYKDAELIQNIIQSGRFLKISEKEEPGFGLCISSHIVRFLSGKQQPLKFKYLENGSIFDITLKFFTNKKDDKKDLQLQKKSDSSSSKMLSIQPDDHCYFEGQEEIKFYDKKSQDDILKLDQDQQLKCDQEISPLIVEGKYEIAQMGLQLNRKLLQDIKNKKIEQKLTDCCSKILIADDEYFNLSCMKLILKKYSTNIDTAFNGEDALTKILNKAHTCCPTCNNNSYKIIFLDICMPILDGMETVKKIKQMCELKIIKKAWVLANSGFCDLKTKKKAYDAGFDHYLTKPIDRDQLDLTITKILLKQQYQ